MQQAPEYPRREHALPKEAANELFTSAAYSHVDDKTETIVDDPEANRLLGRTYREPYTSSDLTASLRSRGN